MSGYDLHVHHDLLHSTCATLWPRVTKLFAEAGTRVPAEFGLSNFSGGAMKTWNPVGTGIQHVQMIFDSGASCTAMPAKLGEGYDIQEDKWTGSEY